MTGNCCRDFWKQLIRLMVIHVLGEMTSQNQQFSLSRELVTLSMRLSVRSQRLRRNVKISELQGIVSTHG